jgi:MFS family permease
MIVGRFGADTMIARFGRTVVLLVSCATAIVGSTLALAGPNAQLAVLGYLVVGLGCAAIVPITYTAAGALPGSSPPRAIAAVTTIGYSGLLASPVVVGLLAAQTSLTVALALPGALLLTVVPATIVARRTCTILHGATPRGRAQRLTESDRAGSSSPLSSAAPQP